MDKYFSRKLGGGVGWGREGGFSDTADPNSEVEIGLKVKDMEHDVDLTKNYCITYSIQKIAQFVYTFLRYSRF